MKTDHLGINFLNVFEEFKFSSLKMRNSFCIVDLKQVTICFKLHMYSATLAGKRRLM